MITDMDEYTSTSELNYPLFVTNTAAYARRHERTGEWHSSLNVRFDLCLMSTHLFFFRVLSVHALSPHRFCPLKVSSSIWLTHYDTNSPCYFCFRTGKWVWWRNGASYCHYPTRKIASPESYSGNKRLYNSTFARVDTIYEICYQYWLTSTLVFSW